MSDAKQLLEALEKAGATLRIGNVIIMRENYINVNTYECNAPMWTVMTADDAGRCDTSDAYKTLQEALAAATGEQS